MTGKPPALHVHVHASGALKKRTLANESLPEWGSWWNKPARRARGDQELGMSHVTCSNECESLSLMEEVLASNLNATARIGFSLFARGGGGWRLMLHC